jgi:hypothetical protein
MTAGSCQHAGPITVASGTSGRITSPVSHRPDAGTARAADPGAGGSGEAALCRVRPRQALGSSRATTADMCVALARSLRFRAAPSRQGASVSCEPVTFSDPAWIFARRASPPIWSATWVARVAVVNAPERVICAARADLTDAGSQRLLAVAQGVDEHRDEGVGEQSGRGATLPGSSSAASGHGEGAAAGGGDAAGEDRPVLDGRTGAEIHHFVA